MTFKNDIRANRARLIKVIHVARRELQMDESTYRLMLQNLTGKDSTTALDPRELKAVVDHLKKKGFKVRASRPGAAPRQADRRQANSPSARKVRALWLFLHQLGAVRDPSERALAAYCKRIAKVDDLHWADGAALDLLVETMKKWAMRYLPAVIKQLGQQLAAVVAAGDPARMPVALKALDSAQGCLQRGQGFDMHWWAWEVLTQASGQPVPADLADAAPVAAAQL